MRTSLIAGVLALLLFPPSTGLAQERLCDTAFEDCRTPLWALIDAETVGVDVAFWFMQDASFAVKLINKHNSGVPVRIIVDPRANPIYNGNQQILEQLRAAGIPMRFKLSAGILHWKMMLFAGQNKIEFSGGNFSPDFFVPQSPFTNYIDEAVYFSDDLSLVRSFKKKFDDLWTDTIRYGNFGNITGPLVRRYPTFPVDPELNFPPSVDDSQDFFNRTQLNFNRETQKIDIIMYRITNQRYTDATLAAVNRGLPVRLLHEPNEYRNPARQWDSWNVDRLFMGGVQIKMRKHMGLNHEKAVLLYSQAMTIFGSSNWTGPSSNFQEEHNYFTTKQWFFQWFVNHFERKWNSVTENEPFVPLPPSEPSYIAPANSASGQPTTVKLEWEGGPWAHKYDVHFGTNPNPPLFISNVSTVQSGAATGQPLLDTGSVDDGIKETLTLPVTLQEGTTYFWRIVGKTMANKTATGPVWSFVTAGSQPPPPAPTGLTATALSSSQINLAWNDITGETGYRVERSLNGTSGWTEIASLAANQTLHSDLQVDAERTYFYRVRALNLGGFSPYSNVANATTPQPPTPTPTPTPSPTSPPSLQFSSSDYSVNEGGLFATITVTRTGNTSATNSVHYSTADASAQSKGDYIIATGILTFNPGETSQSFRLLVIDDLYLEGNEVGSLILSNPSGGALLGSPNAAAFTIVDNDSVSPTTNPLDDPQFFVRQQYLDFLNRQPDVGGLNFWVNEITSCGSDAQCLELKRINVSAAFFLSIEFQETGVLACLTNKAAFGVLPLNEQFEFDRQGLQRNFAFGAPGSAAQLEANKRAYFNELVGRPEFQTRYGGVSNSQFVDTLISNTGVPFTSSERDALVNGLSNGAETRATVLRKIAEKQSFKQAEFNRIFVLMQYFGYLKRDPDTAGFNFWLNKLNFFNGNFLNAEMVKAFLVSTEYRARFSSR